MDNAKAFIDEGGIAEWQYLKFKHNEHQVEEARKMAEDIGFDKFVASQPYLSPAYHWKTGERYYLEPAAAGEFDRTRIDDHSERWEEHFATPGEFTENIKNNSSLQGFKETDLQGNPIITTSLTRNTYVKEKNCMHVDVDGNGNYSLFLTVSGKVLPCCYFELVGVAREKFDMKTLDIKTEFNTGNYRITCLRMCGSIE